MLDGDYELRSRRQQLLWNFARLAGVSDTESVLTELSANEKVSIMHASALVINRLC